MTTALFGGLAGVLTALTTLVVALGVIAKGRRETKKELADKIEKDRLEALIPYKEQLATLREERDRQVAAANNDRDYWRNQYTELMRMIQFGRGE